MTKKAQTVLVDLVINELIRRAVLPSKLCLADRRTVAGAVALMVEWFDLDDSRPEALQTRTDERGKE